MARYATLIKAKKDAMTVTVYYTASTPCTSLPTYGSSLPPLYLSVQG